MFGLTKEEAGREEDPEERSFLMLVVDTPFLMVATLVLHGTFKFQMRISLKDKNTEK